MMSSPIKFEINPMSVLSANVRKPQHCDGRTVGPTIPMRTPAKFY